MTRIWVVLDSTELRRARASLNDGDIQALLAAQRNYGVRLAVPEVVVQEVQRAIQDEARAAVQKANSFLGEYATWVQIDDTRLHDGMVQAAIQARQANFRHELQINQFRILSLPQVSHDQMLVRDLANRRPFFNKEGYRDALIWETILALAVEEPVPVIFISANKRDFGKGELDPALKEDLREKGIQEGRILLFHSAKECWQVFLSPKTRKITEALGGSLQSQVQVAQYEGVIRQIHLRFSEMASSVGILDGDLYREYPELVLHSLIDDPVLTAIEAATELPDGTRMFSCRGTFRALGIYTLRRISNSFSFVDHRELGGVLLARIVVPPQGSPHTSVDFWITTNRGLSEPAKRYVAWLERDIEPEGEEEE